MPRLITKTRMAELAGVKAPTISRMVGEGQRLHPALVGSKLDQDHPAVVEYLTERGVTPEPPPSSSVPESIESFADMTLRELIEGFGTDERFESWLKSLKTIEEIQDRRIKNQAAQGRLISREVVDKHVFGAIEATYVRLLNDTPKTIAGQMQAAVKSGQAIEELETLARDLISAQLKQLKDKAKRGLMAAGAPEEDD